MNQEILDRIDALAIKLGTTAEYLWPLLVGHAQTTAMAAVGGNLVGLLMIAFAAFLLKRKIASMEINTYDDGRELLAIMGTIFIVGGIIGCLVGVCCGIPDMLYPEATALRSIIR